MLREFTRVIKNAPRLGFEPRTISLTASRATVAPSGIGKTLNRSRLYQTGGGIGILAHQVNSVLFLHSYGFRG